MANSNDQVAYNSNAKDKLHVTNKVNIFCKQHTTFIHATTE
jgi:hypothetical protein